MKKMLILRGIAGYFAGRDWPRGALDEPSALAYAQARGFEGVVLDVPGAAYDGSPQVLEALRMFRHDHAISAFYGFSGGGYNLRHVINDLAPHERQVIELVVVLGAPRNLPSVYEGPWELVWRDDPPSGHMDGPRALLHELSHE